MTDQYQNYKQMVLGHFAEATSTPLKDTPSGQTRIMIYGTLRREYSFEYDVAVKAVAGIDIQIADVIFEDKGFMIEVVNYIAKLLKMQMDLAYVMSGDGSDLQVMNNIFFQLIDGMTLILTPPEQ